MIDIDESSASSSSSSSCSCPSASLLPSNNKNHNASDLSQARLCKSQLLQMPLPLLQLLLMRDRDRRPSPVPVRLTPIMSMSPSCPSSNSSSSSSSSKTTIPIPISWNNKCKLEQNNNNEINHKSQIIQKKCNFPIEEHLSVYDHLLSKTFSFLSQQLTRSSWSSLPGCSFSCPYKLIPFHYHHRHRKCCCSECPPDEYCDNGSDIIINETKKKSSLIATTPTTTTTTTANTVTTTPASSNSITIKPPLLSEEIRRRRMRTTTTKRSSSSSSSDYKRISSKSSTKTAAFPSYSFLPLLSLCFLVVLLSEIIHFSSASSIVTRRSSSIDTDTILLTTPTPKNRTIKNQELVGATAAMAAAALSQAENNILINNKSLPLLTTTTEMTKGGVEVEKSESDEQQRMKLNQQQQERSEIVSGFNNKIDSNGADGEEEEEIIISRKSNNPIESESGNVVKNQNISKSTREVVAVVEGFIDDDDLRLNVSQHFFSRGSSSNKTMTRSSVSDKRPRVLISPLAVKIRAPHPHHHSHSSPPVPFTNDLSQDKSDFGSEEGKDIDEATQKRSSFNIDKSGEGDGDDDDDWWNGGYNSTSQPLLQSSSSSSSSGLCWFYDTTTAAVPSSSSSLNGEEEVMMEITEPSINLNFTAAAAPATVTFPSSSSISDKPHPTTFGGKSKSAMSGMNMMNPVGVFCNGSSNLQLTLEHISNKLASQVISLHITTSLIPALNLTLFHRFPRLRNLSVTHSNVTQIVGTCPPGLLSLNISFNCIRRIDSRVFLENYFSSSNNNDFYNNNNNNDNSNISASNFNSNSTPKTSKPDRKRQDKLETKSSSSSLKEKESFLPRNRISRNLRNSSKLKKVVVVVDNSSSSASVDKLKESRETSSFSNESNDDDDDEEEEEEEEEDGNNYALDGKEIQAATATAAEKGRENDDGHETINLRRRIVKVNSPSTTTATTTTTTVKARSGSSSNSLVDDYDDEDDDCRNGNNYSSLCKSNSVREEKEEEKIIRGRKDKYGREISSTLKEKPADYFQKQQQQQNSFVSSGGADSGSFGVSGGSGSNKEEEEESKKVLMDMDADGGRRITTEKKRRSILKSLRGNSDAAVVDGGDGGTGGVVSLSLEDIDLSHNKISEVPYGLLELQSLHSLRLSGNQLKCDFVWEKLADWFMKGSDQNILKDGDDTFCGVVDDARVFQFTVLGVLKAKKDVVETCETVNKSICDCSLYSLNKLAGNGYNLSHESPRGNVAIALKLDCSNRNLTDLPPVPAQTWQLNVSGNLIKDLDPLKGRMYENLLILDADNNQINVLDGLTATSFLDKYNYLSLQNNHFSVIPSNVLSSLKNMRGQGVTLLGANYIDCDCEVVKEIKPLLLENSKQIKDSKEIFCQNMKDHSGTTYMAVVNLHYTDLCYLDTEEESNEAFLFLIIFAEVLLILVIVAKVWHDQRTFRRTGILPWCSAKMPRLPCDAMLESVKEPPNFNRSSSTNVRSVACSNSNDHPTTAQSISSHVQLREIRSNSGQSEKSSQISQFSSFPCSSSRTSSV